MPENKGNRARRLLLERRLTVERADESGLVVASCRGDSGTVHRLGYDPGKREFRCTCDANRRFRRECAHLVALKFVVVVNGRKADG